jgi:hypothetical protein
MNFWFYIRGGTGVITDNDFPLISSCAWGTKNTVSLQVQTIRRNAGQVPCWIGYPAPRQIGQGANGTLNPLYIWNNTGTGADNIGIVDYNPDECGNNQRTADYVQSGRDWIPGPRPNYQKFTYPHPFRASARK